SLTGQNATKAINRTRLLLPVTPGRLRRDATSVLLVNDHIIEISSHLVVGASTLRTRLDLRDTGPRRREGEKPSRVQDQVISQCQTLAGCQRDLGPRRRSGSALEFGHIAESREQRQAPHAAHEKVSAGAE